MKILNTAHLPPNPTPIESLAIYNGFDVMSVLEIFPQLFDLLTETKKRTYFFELELGAPLLEMEFNGTHVDLPERDRLIKQHQSDLFRISATLHSLCSAVGYYRYYIRMACAEFSAESDIPIEDLPTSWEGWIAKPLGWRRSTKQAAPLALPAYHKALKVFGSPFNPRSADQKKRLFYDFFGHRENTVSQAISPNHPPPWNKTRGITEVLTRGPDGYTPSTDRDTLEKIKAKYVGDPRDAITYAMPFLLLCLEAADLAKALDFLRCPLEKGMFRSTFAGATETGRLSSRANSQGYGSNGQNVDPRLRTVFTVPMGYRLAALDYEQIESRIVGAICYRLFGAVNYLAATESGDLHSLACSMVWEDAPWPKDFTLDWLLKHGPFPKDLIKAAKAVAGKEFYRGKSMRDASKTLGHGTNYLGKPPQMSKHSHIPVALIQHYQSVYFAAFPEVAKWHRWVIEQVQTKGEITTFLGRTRQFFGRPTDDATIREAVAFEPQSVAADYTNSALLAIYKSDLPLKLFLQKHDEIGFRFKEEDAARVITAVKQIMERDITLEAPDGTPRVWRVPVEVESGWNLGRRKITKEGEVINPDGLSSYPDDRTRSRNPFDFFRQII